MPATALPGAQPAERWGAHVCRPSAGLIYSRVCPSLMFAQREEEERAGRAAFLRTGPGPPRARPGRAPAPAARLGPCSCVRACVRSVVCLF